MLWVTFAELLPLKFESPPYVAVSFDVPLSAKVKVQLPLALLSTPLQVSPVLAVTVTLPVGVPKPVTVNPIITGCPTTDGFGVSDVMVVVLLAGFTVRFTESVVGA